MALTTNPLSDDDLVKRHEQAYARFLTAKDANEELGGAMGVVTGMLKGGVMAGVAAGITIATAAAFMPAAWGVSDATILVALKVGFVGAVLAGAYAGGIADPITYKRELDDASTDYSAVRDEASSRPHLADEIAQSNTTVEANLLERVTQRRASHDAQRNHENLQVRMGVIHKNTP